MLAINQEEIEQEITQEFTTEYNTDEIIERFKSFEESSYTKYKELFDQIKEDRRYISGDQKDDIDSKLLDTDIGESVPSMTLNVVKNAIRTVVNSYLPNPFKWNYDDEKLNKKSDLFLSEPDNSTAAVEALNNAVGSGLGILVFSNDYAVDGTLEPILYSVPDVTNVRLDPNASKLNFADATKAAIVELKSKEWFRSNYDIECANEYYEPLIDISEEYDRKTLMPLVTYYEKDENGVTCYKLAGSDLIEDPVLLPYSYIPVVPVFGESDWIDSNKQSWTGITTALRPIQRQINLAYRNIIIRAAKVPKNTWVGSDEALQGREMYWKNAEKNLNPIRIYNGYSKDGSRKLEPPQREDNQIIFGDVSALMDKSLSLINAIIGIPAIGLETNVTRTATEVLTNQNTFNNNVRNYIEHLKYSMQLIGLLFAEDAYQQLLYGKLKVTVVAGPDDAMSKQEARVQLSQFANLITTDSDRRQLLLANCDIESDNKYISRFAQSLAPQPTEGELQAQQMIEQANMEIKSRDSQIFELQNQLQEIQLQQQLQAYGTEQQILLNNQKHASDMEKLVFQARLEDSNPIEQAKSQAELVKAQIGVEKDAIALRKEEINSLGAINYLNAGENNI